MITEVMSSNPIQARIFFRSYFQDCLLLVVFITANIAIVLISQTTVHIYDFHIFTVKPLNESVSPLMSPVCKIGYSGKF